MCFSEDGPLFKDFHALFNEVFGSTSLVKGDILRALADGSATCSELDKRLGVERGGSLTRNLEALRTALVYDGELAPSVIRNGVFDYLIPFDDLLRS